MTCEELADLLYAEREASKYRARQRAIEAEAEKRDWRSFLFWVIAIPIIVVVGLLSLGVIAGTLFG